MSENAIPPCSIWIDKEGRWFYKGIEMIRRDFIRLFYENMEPGADGRCIITLAGDRCYVEVEDTPFVVWQTEVGPDDSGDMRFFLHLSDDSQEELNPETLHVGKDNVLYCRVRDRAFPARFNRSAYYQLAEHIEEKNGEFFLPVKDRYYPVLEANFPRE